MARYRQATLRKKIRTLGINGKLPMAQSVLALVGYTPDVLDAMLAQEAEWGTSKSERSRRLGEQKMATTTQENGVAATKLLIYNFHDSLPRLCTFRMRNKGYLAGDSRKEQGFSPCPGLAGTWKK